MTLQTWWLYVTAVFLIAATPGPNMLHVMTQSIHHGVRRSAASMAGLMTAVLACLFASAAGLGALLKASPMLFDLLRYAGVAYLVWLGIKAWRAPVGGDANAEKPAPPSLRAMYATGLGTGFSNPKLIVFAAALFPQFLDTAKPFAPQLAILVASFIVIEVFWYTVYAFGGRSLAAWLARPNRQRLFNRVTGGIFVAFGAALFGSRV
ncbi:LysE family translocator [Sphingomonas sp. BT-65]|uniref:LysE family translocator n=1 Tax=Sphingomonas sp. BT-65 TaxID=2989821 RepID=UPI00223655FC|nr:LysE family translocator [Sphingomonas sp. BT-65]MCW4462540.1 LysE family translocator [Sphingomonas sp. BT-65]